MARMYNVSPASQGVGGSVSDADLMHSAITTHDLKQLLRNTAHRPSLPSAHGAIGGLGMLLVKSGRPGRVPSVAATKRMIDVMTKGLLNIEDPLVSTGMKGPAAGPLSFNGMNTFTCATNNPPTSGWISWRTTVSPSCGVGYNGTGVATNSGLTTLSGALSFINTPTVSAQASMWQLNGQSGLGGGRRRKYEYRRSSAIRSVARQATTPLAVGEPTVNAGPPPGFGPGGGVSSGAGASGDWSDAPAPSPVELRKPHKRGTNVRRHFATIPRVRRRPTLRGYEKPGIQLTVVPGAPGQPPVIAKKEAIIHREVPTKEKKTKKKLGFALLNAYHNMTEINDLFDALAEAIPGKPCSSLPGFAKMACVLEHWDEIDPIQAAKNIIANEIEDQVVARLQGALQGALQQSGGPNATQVNQWVRTLRTLTR